VATNREGEGLGNGEPNDNNGEILETFIKLMVASLLDWSLARLIKLTTRPG
jgi:hypothetical protein